MQIGTEVKKVLVITYYWPPSGGSGVQRWVKFAKYLNGENWQPVIYTPSNPDYNILDDSLEKEIPASVQIIKQPIREIYGLYRKLTGKKGKAAQVNPITAKNNTWKDDLCLAIRGNLFIPDPRIAWLRPSVKFLTKYLKEHPVDMIVSTGPPHSMHLIAQKVARKTGIPWIADFRDPWTKIFYFKHLHLTAFSEKKYKKLEQSVLDDANAIVAVSPLVQEDFQAMTSTPVHLITNGYDESDFQEDVTPDGFFNITHSGLLVSDGNPDVLWKVLAEKVQTNPEMAARLKIRLVGKTDQDVLDTIRQAGLAPYLVDLGYQSHSTAIRELKNASILILPIRKEPETKAILPGKLFEYLAARKPILGIADPEGAMSRVLTDSGAGISCDWTDEEEISSFIDKVWEDFKAGRSQEYADIARFSRKELTAQMAGLMNSLTK